ncbi:hypothetical protein L9G16_24370, partial [Shewanella sp. A25]|nr:hypothetical protein [Shewanella shenzhenensis]
MKEKKAGDGLPTESVDKLGLEFSEINRARLDWGHEVRSNDLRHQSGNVRNPLQVLHQGDIVRLAYGNDL